MAGCLEVEVRVQTYKGDLSHAQELVVENLWNKRDIVKLTVYPDGTSQQHEVWVSARALTDALRRCSDVG